MLPLRHATTTKSRQLWIKQRKAVRKKNRTWSDDLLNWRLLIVGLEAGRRKMANFTLEGVPQLDRTGKQGLIVCAGVLSLHISHFKASAADWNTKQNHTKLLIQPWRYYLRSLTLPAVRQFIICHVLSISVNRISRVLSTSLKFPTCCV